MSKYHDRILEHLAFAIRRDREKGGDGWRSTSEVAARLEVKTAVARQALDGLLAAGLVEWSEPIEGLGHVHHWRLAEPTGGDGGEPLSNNDNACDRRLRAA